MLMDNPLSDLSVTAERTQNTRGNKYRGGTTNNILHIDRSDGLANSVLCTPG